MKQLAIAISYFHSFLKIGKLQKYSKVKNMVFPIISKDLEMCRNSFIFCSDSYTMFVEVAIAT